MFTLFILTTSYCHYAYKATEHCLLCSFLPLPTVITLTRQQNTVYFVHSDHFLLSLCLQGNRTMFTLFILTIFYCHYAYKATEHCLLCSFLPLPTVIMLTRQQNTAVLTLSHSTSLHCHHTNKATEH